VSGERGVDDRQRGVDWLVYGSRRENVSSEEGREGLFRERNGEEK
jgi:hypothetical protein